MLRASRFTHPGHQTWCGTGGHEQLGGRVVHTLTPQSHPSSCFPRPSSCLLHCLFFLNASRSHPQWERQPQAVWVSSAPETTWVTSSLSTWLKTHRNGTFDIMNLFNWYTSNMPGGMTPTGLFFTLLTRRKLPRGRCHVIQAALSPQSTWLWQCMILGGPRGGYQATAEWGDKPNPKSLQEETGISAQISMATM